MAVSETYVGRYDAIQRRPVKTIAMLDASLCRNAIQPPAQTRYVDALALIYRIYRGSAPTPLNDMAWYQFQ